MLQTTKLAHCKWVTQKKVIKPQQRNIPLFSPEMSSGNKNPSMCLWQAALINAEAYPQLAVKDQHSELFPIPILTSSWGAKLGIWQPSLPTIRGTEIPKKSH